MRTVGWRVAGIEIDPVAAAKAKAVTPEVFVGDPVEAPSPPARSTSSRHSTSSSTCPGRCSRSRA